MTIKKWPKDKKEILDFEKVITPIKKALLFAFDIKRKNEGKRIPYNGYDAESWTHCCLEADFAFTVAGQKYFEDQGIDMLDEILAITFRLGMEQGLRQSAKDSCVLLMADFYKRMN